MRLPLQWCFQVAIPLTLAVVAAPAADAAAHSEGLRWAGEHALSDEQTAWLVQTAGHPAQPQAGLPQLVAPPQPALHPSSMEGLPRLVLQQPTKRQIHPPTIAAFIAMIAIGGVVSATLAIKLGITEGPAAAALAVGFERPLDVLGRCSAARLGLPCLLAALALLDWVAFRSIHAGGGGGGVAPVPHGGSCSFLAWYLILVPPVVALTVASQVFSTLKLRACRTEQVPMGRMMYRSTASSSSTSTSGFGGGGAIGGSGGSNAAKSPWALFATLPRPPPHNRSPEPEKLSGWWPRLGPPSFSFAAVLGTELLLMAATDTLAFFGGCGCEVGLRWSAIAFSFVSAAVLLTMASWSAGGIGESPEAWLPLSAARNWQPLVI